jgi:hypothetical protein
MAPQPPFSPVTIPPTPPRTEPRTIVIETELLPLVDDDRPELEELVAMARMEREMFRAELRRRLALVHLEQSALPWYAQPWAKLGAAALVGYAIGRSRALRVVASLTFGATLALAIDRALAHGEPASALR